MNILIIMILNGSTFLKLNVSTQVGKKVVSFNSNKLKYDINNSQFTAGIYVIIFTSKEDTLIAKSERRSHYYLTTVLVF